MTDIINLQNSPIPDNISTEQVSFNRQGTALKGTIYKPANLEGTSAAVVVSGAWTTVKEQMSGTYARELAKRGIVALAFDFSGWGESEGEPRYVEDPTVKTADILAAAKYMTSRDDVNPSQVAGLGICASSGYMADAVSNSLKLCKLALIAPWFHNPTLAEGVYGGAEVAADLIAQSESQAASNTPVVLIAASTTDATAPMYQAPYYTEAHRGLIKEYDNKFSVLSWKPWLNYDGLASAEHMSKPVLMVGSSGMALPAGAVEYERRLQSPLRKLWFGDDVSQFDFYDRKDTVLQAANAVADFIQGK